MDCQGKAWSIKDGPSLIFKLSKYVQTWCNSELKQVYMTDLGRKDVRRSKHTKRMGKDGKDDWSQSGESKGRSDLGFLIHQAPSARSSSSNWNIPPLSAIDAFQ